MIGRLAMGEFQDWVAGCSGLAFLFALLVAALLWWLREKRVLRRSLEDLRRQVAALERVTEGLQRRLAVAEERPVGEVPTQAASEPLATEATAAPPLRAQAVVGTGTPEPPSPEPLPTPLPVRPSRSRLEERLGGRLPVWIGSVALALAGAYLVKYSVDQGWLGAPVRLTLGILFGLVLLGLGEGLHRQEGTVPQGLAAAGVAVLFASFLAGVNLYGLIPPWAGFALMALTAAVAVVLSLRRGVMVAVIGLVGGLLTPYWIRLGEPDPWMLFGYLLLLEAGLLAVSRRRGWGGLALLTLGGGLVWILSWLVGPFAPHHGLPLGLFLVGTAAVAAVAGWRPGRAGGGPGRSAGIFPGVAAAGLLGSVGAMAAVTRASGYGLLEWAFVGLLALGILLAARLDDRLWPLAPLAAVVVVVLLLLWAGDLSTPRLDRFLVVVSSLGGLFGLGSYLALWRADRAGAWASLSAASGVVFLLVAFAGGSRVSADLPWGAVSLGLAGLYLAGALPVARRRGIAPGGAAALAALAVAVTVFVSLAVPLELERQWLTVAWALEVPALVWLEGRFRLPALAVLAGALAALVGVRLLANPLVLTYPVGAGRVLNWIVYAYGVPLLAFAAAAWQIRRRDDTARLASLLAGLDWGALLFAVALVTLEIRQGFHPGRLTAGQPGLAEWGTFIAAWLCLGWGVLEATRGRLVRLRVPERLYRGGRGLVVLGGLGVLVGPCLLVNPLWRHIWVGSTPVVNLLLFSYGLPALLLGFLARAAGRSRETSTAALLSVGALALTFLLVTLEVRQLFHGGWLDAGGVRPAEQYAYSAAWIVLGTALLVAGIVRRGAVLRYASLAVMSVAVVKVFLFDTANLTGLYRVFSFLGLGASLLVLAYLYQRFVLRREEP